VRLEALQQFLQSVVVHPGSTADALKDPRTKTLLAGRGIESVLLPSPTLTPAQRVAIYQEMYPMRMRDALSSDYPAIEHFLGDRFWDFVVAYTKAHPSMRYTLNRLGDHVPAFIARQRTFGPRPFLFDLAKLELAITEAFDADESALLKARDLETYPPSKLARSRLLMVPSLRLVALDWNAGAYLDTLRDDDHRHPKPKQSRSFVAIVRRNYSVYRLSVSEPAFHVLTDLRDGLRIEEVVRRALARKGPRKAAAADFASWFKNWTSEGFFAGITTIRKKSTTRT